MLKKRKQIGLGARTASTFPGASWRSQRSRCACTLRRRTVHQARFEGGSIVAGHPNATGWNRRLEKTESSGLKTRDKCVAAPRDLDKQLSRSSFFLTSIRQRAGIAWGLAEPGGRGEATLDLGGGPRRQLPERNLQAEAGTAPGLLLLRYLAAGRHRPAH